MHKIFAFLKTTYFTILIFGANINRGQPLDFCNIGFSKVYFKIILRRKKSFREGEESFQKQGVRLIAFELSLKKLETF